MYHCALYLTCRIPVAVQIYRVRSWLLLLLFLKFCARGGHSVFLSSDHWLIVLQIDTLEKELGKTKPEASGQSSTPEQSKKTKKSGKSRKLKGILKKPKPKK